MTPFKPRTLVSWACYDFANTIFSAVVLTAYFPLYLTDLAGAHWYLGAATTASMLLAGAATPFFGALSDQTGRTKNYLIRTTLVCILFFFSLALVHNLAGLMFSFLAACFFYHASLVFYNSLLPVAAPPEKQGWASGLGTGLGYLGVVAALPIAHLADRNLGRPAVFAVGALLFLLFSLPLFFFVPERKVEHPVVFRWNLWFEEWKKVWETVKKLPARPVLLLFLAGNFFTVDALNSAIFWISVYTREVFHPGQGNLIVFLIALNASAFAAGILAGILTDRLGASLIFTLSSGCLAATLALLASAPDFRTFVILALTGGAFAISGIWTAGRKRLMELAPSEKAGEYFGLYGLTTKISVIGSLIFSVAADLAGFRTALWLLVFPAGAGCLCLGLHQGSAAQGIDGHSN